MKRTLLIITAVVLLVLIGVGAYFLFFNKGPALSGGNGATFPDSNTAGVTETPTNTSTQELGVPLPGAGTEIAPKLVRISDRPVAVGSVATYVPGLTPATSTASGTPIAAYEPDVRVEYVERESGNIYGYQAHGRTLTRLSNKTLPGIQEAVWLSDGSEAFVRFLERTTGGERVSTYALPAVGQSGYFLESGLEQVLVRGTSTLVTLLSTSDGSSATISTPSGNGVRTLFTSPLSSIRLAFAGTDFVATTKASAHSDGYAFLVDSKSGSFTRLLGPLQSLTTLPSPSGNLLLYSYLDQGKVALAVLDLTTHVATRLPLSTFPDKCAWTPDSQSIYCGVPTTLTGSQPDDWYQGASHFSDRLWRIGLADRVASLVIDPKQAANTDLDMTALSLDRTADVLIFRDKNTGALYAYDL